MKITGRPNEDVTLLVHKEEIGFLPKKRRLNTQFKKKISGIDFKSAPSRETKKAVDEVNQERKELEAMKIKANKALELSYDSALKNPEKNKMRIELDWDMRNKSRATYQAKIISDNGLVRAEVWGTKSGKARSFPGLFNDESDVDGLDAEGREQLKKALYVTRQIITRKEEYASDDDSAPESGSDTSDEERNS